MGKLVDFVTSLHQSTSRKYLDRMIDNKIDCMIEAKKYGENYWDGDRKFGYGGYKYIPGRWKPLAEKLIETYNLKPNSKILDVGCGKGFLLFEIKKIIPEIEVVGIDSSHYGLDNAHPDIKEFLFNHNAQDKLPFSDNEFDLVITVTTFHNLKLFELADALGEIERVARKGYLVVESYRQESELFNLQCWALTCESFFDDKEWQWLFNKFGYTGDYEFIYFE